MGWFTHFLYTVKLANMPPWLPYILSSNGVHDGTFQELPLHSVSQTQKPTQMVGLGISSLPTTLVISHIRKKQHKTISPCSVLQPGLVSWYKDKSKEKNQLFH